MSILLWGGMSDRCAQLKTGLMSLHTDESQPKKSTSMVQEESRLSPLSPLCLWLYTSLERAQGSSLCCTHPFISRSGNKPEAAFLFRKCNTGSIHFRIQPWTAMKSDQIRYLISLIIRVRTGQILSLLAVRIFGFQNFRYDQKMENKF